jgi:mannose-1-phosphate guanylyltransferase/phosphomannomutase
MRWLVEIHPAEDLELVDGVKILNHQLDDSWVLILPDAGEPVVHLFVNSNDRDWADETLREYRNRVQAFIAQEQGAEANSPRQLAISD